MYFYVICFQIACILVSGVCLYLALTDACLRTEKYFMPLMVVFSGIFLMETGYGLYLQEIAMAGLQIAEKVSLFGKLLAAFGFFVTCVSLSDRDKQAVKTAAGVLGLTIAVFLFSNKLCRLLYLRQEFLQNQYFYYIERELTGMGEIFCLFVKCVPLLGILWLLFCKKEKGMPVKLLLMAVLLLWGISSICKRVQFLRHYDADMPLGAALAVCFMIFIVWNAKKVYTDHGQTRENESP